MRREDIITIVRAKMDEVGMPDSITVPEVFSILETTLEESANVFLMKCPLHKQKHYQVPVANQNPNPSLPITQDWGSILLPIDFLRLSYFKMAEWVVPATDAISEQHPLFRNQFNRYLKGKPHNPVVAVTNGMTVFQQNQQPGGQPNTFNIQSRLAYFSMPGGNHTIEKAAYIKRIYRKDDIPGANLNNLMDITSIPDEIVEPLTWQAAGDLFVAVAQPDKANIAFSKVQEYITLNTR